MKTFTNLAMLAALSIFTLSSCSSHTPEAVATNFLEAIYEQDLDTAKDLSTERTHRVLPLVMSMIPAMMERQGIKKDNLSDELSSMECTEKEDRATCTYGKKGGTVALQKVDGNWKVDMKK